MKTIVIKGEINPDMLENIAQQIDKQSIRPGDAVDVAFDTEGGYVDVAFSIAEQFCGMQDEGVQMRAVAESKVWSSGIVPFLACETRVSRNGASFLVHQVKLTTLEETTLDKSELSNMAEEIDNYAGLLNDYYELHGISSEVRSHLLDGDDLKISDPDELITSGFIHAVVEDAPKVTGNYFNKFFEKISPKQPQFAFINKSSTITTQIMTRNQIKQIMDDHLRGVLPEVIAEAVKLVNQQMDAPVPVPAEPLNEGDPLTADELAKLTGVLYKTPAKVDGKPEVKFLAHPGKDVEKDHFVIPIKEDGEVVKLEGGDHRVEIDGEDFVIHSTGEDWYLHGKGIENQEEIEESLIPENAADTEDEKPEPVENRKACNAVKPSAAPAVNRAKISTPTKYAERMYQMAAQYGSGCVGARKR